jgi:hypothetical protein
MVDINKLVESYYNPNELNAPTILQLIEEVMEQNLFDRKTALTEELMPGADLAWSAVPEIPVSELGWARLKTGAGDVKIPSEQRAQLDNFLQNIARGGDLQDKIQKLAEFYAGGSEMMQDLKSANDAETIKKTLAYLTFYKTLTKIITNFNASAAGFAFESFLGVLLGGNQIATGNKTIADLTSGDGTPISLKLYAEATLHVGGSYTDLVNDLIQPPYLMQYVVVMKNLSGKGSDLEGTLKFYRFNFTLENLFDVLSTSRDPYVIMLPQDFVKNPDTFDIELPEFMSTEEAEEMFSNLIKGAMGDAALAERVLQTVDWANNTAIFSAPKRPGFAKISVGQGGRSHRPGSSAPLARLLKAADFTDPSLSASTYGNTEEIVNYFEMIYRANETVREKYLEVNQARREVVDRVVGGSFASPRKSVEFYRTLTPELKRMALRVSRGYVYTDQFSMNRSDVLQVPESALPSGQSAVGIGAIEIGTSKIQGMLNNIRGLINTAIFDIFNNLKLLTINIQAYFAGGMEDEQKADNAIEAADNIGEKTKEVKAKK